VAKNIWFISDTHWSHGNIIKFSERPYQDVVEMNKALTDNWNEVVKPQDEVYHLGDFAFTSHQSIKNIVFSLNGRKHLVYGNHDKEILKKREEFLSMPNGFISIEPYREIKVGEQMICLFHYGCRVWNKAHYGSWMLYGHSHGSLPPYGKSVDVGVDAKFIHNEYRPTHFEEIQLFMERQSYQGDRNGGV